METWNERLDWFKENEKPEVVLVIADDPAKYKILIAWTNTTVHQVETPGEPSGDHIADWWRWLWDGVTFDGEELRAKSAASNLSFDKQLQFLIGNRLIYPDGTMNSFVQRYLRDKVLKLFDSKPARPRKKRTS